MIDGCCFLRSGRRFRWQPSVLLFKWEVTNNPVVSHMPTLTFQSTMIIMRRRCTVLKPQILTPGGIVRTDSKQSPIAATVVDEPGRRLLRRFQAMHHPHPEVDHPDRLGKRPEIADVLVQGNIVVLDQRRTRLHRLGLNMVPYILQVPLIFRRELHQVSRGPWNILM